MPIYTTILRYAIVVAAFAQVLAAYSFGAGRFEQNNRDYLTYIQPDGWAFSIWGLIFALAIAFAIYQAVPQHDNQLLRRVRLPALLAFIGASAWIYFATATNWTVWLTVPILLGMAGALSYVVAQPAVADPKAQWFSYSTLLPYAAWTGIAQWLNVLALISAQGYITSGSLNLSLNVLFLCVIAAYALYWLRVAGYSIWYGGVIIWASIGIIATNTSTPEGSVIIIAMAGALGLAAMALVRHYTRTT